ncbi:MAG: hypothetical protein DMF97_15385, partial [Acidobacteria bacterium]
MGLLLTETKHRHRHLIIRSKGEAPATKRHDRTQRPQRTQRENQDFFAAFALAKPTLAESLASEGWAFAFTRFSRAAPLHLERLSARSSSVASMAPRTGNYPDDRATSAISDVSRPARNLTWYSSCIVQMEWIDNAAARFLTASRICPQPSRAGPAARPRSPARWPSLSGGLGAKKN